MAVKSQEVELLISGTDQNRPAKGQFYQNLYYKNGAIRVRPGLGQIAQYDTSMSMRTSDGSQMGYTTHLGSSIMTTDFGHTQIISALASSCYTGNHENRGSWTNVYSINIHDITTGERWEEIIHKHTSEMKDSVSPPSEWHGVYETNKDENVGGWVRSTYSQFFFEEAFDSMFFGSKDAGLYCYIPADFNGNRRKQVDGTTNTESCMPYSESSIIIPVSMAPGVYSAAYEYLTKEAFQNPADAALFMGRLAVARGRTIFFSDMGKPASYIGINSIDIPSEKEITAIESINDVLIAFTETESFLYQPNVRGTLVNAGRIISMSSNIGCVGPNGVSKTEGAMTWIDKNGVYSSSGRADIKPISTEINPFFNSTISNPLTSYYQNLGKTDLLLNQPRTNYSARNLASCNITYCAPKEMTIISVPAMNIALVYQAGRWLIWSVETMVVTPRRAKSAVGTEPTINSPWFLCDGDDIYAFGGIERFISVDMVTPARNSITSSFYLMKFGRGGGLDRTVHESEDNRDLSCYYESSGDTDGCVFYLDEPIEQPDGTFLLPVCVRDKYSSGYDGPEKLHLEFSISNLWAPVGGTVSPIFPPERLATSAGWTVNFSAPTITITWQDQPAMAYHFKPKMNLSPSRKNPLMFIPMERTVSSYERMSMGISLISAYSESNSVQFTAGLYYYNKSDSVRLNKDDSVARPIDWAIKSGQVGYGQGVQVKLRTIYSSLSSRGNASESPTDFDWDTGLLNMTISSDWKDYATQINDIGNGSKQDADGNTIRNRLNDNAKIFGGDGKWGEASLSSAAGNVLVDDEGLDTISSSNSIKGEHVSVMAFGHTRNRAEGLVVDSMKATIKPVGGRRRKGR
tara:strand:- start:3484 stop:6057 length:2574 start_codon:yes stop_codon:yes gene_type:complete